MGAGEVNRQEFFSDDLKNTRWLGEVVNNNDPDNFTGRIKVRVFGKFDELEEEDIPWAYPTGYYSGGSATGSGTFSLPKIGSIVSITFDNGNIYHPEYRFQQGISDELKEEIGNEDDYLTAHSLIYDTEIEGSLKDFYTITQGKVEKLANSMIRLHTNGDINITTDAAEDYTLDDEANHISIFEDETFTVNMNGASDMTFGDTVDVDITGVYTLTGASDIDWFAEADYTLDVSSTYSLICSTISLGSDQSSAQPGVLGDNNADVLEDLRSNLSSLATEVSKLAGYVGAWATAQSALSSVVLYAPVAATASAGTSALPQVATVGQIIAAVEAISADIPQTKSGVVTLD